MLLKSCLAIYILDNQRESAGRQDKMVSTPAQLGAQPASLPTQVF